MQRIRQKKFAIAIIIIISISLIGSSFVAIFLPGQNQSFEEQRQQALEREYQSRQERVQQLSKIVEENPDNTEALVLLADAYLEKSRVTGQLGYVEYEEDLERAVELYQRVLDKQSATDMNDIMLKLATAAFFLGDIVLAETTYVQLLENDPKNVDALYGYGLLLFYSKQEFIQAEEKWQEALKITTDEQMKARLEEMIKVVEAITSSANNQQN